MIEKVIKDKDSKHGELKIDKKLKKYNVLQLYTLLQLAFYSLYIYIRSII